MRNLAAWIGAALLAAAWIGAVLLAALYILGCSGSVFEALSLLLS